jgi:hypothetical protein
MIAAAHDRMFGKAPELDLLIFQRQAAKAAPGITKTSPPHAQDLRHSNFVPPTGIPQYCGFRGYEFRLIY